MNELLDFFIDAYREKPSQDIIIESAVFFFGIWSVWLAKKENIWVYPTGLIATVLTVYLMYKARYFGEVLINIYYSVMSIYGWYRWSNGNQGASILRISRTNRSEKIKGIGLFVLTIFVIYLVYRGFDYDIKIENYLDLFTSGLFFTAMWFMALKKIENWTLWIIGDLIAIPLCAHRDLGMLALQYFIFTILAIMAYLSWRKTLQLKPQI